MPKELKFRRPANGSKSSGSAEPAHRAPVFSWIEEDFANPGNRYRGKPFWSWNGKLDHDELLRQIRIFKTMGFGGFVIHSRIGLITEYLSEEWFDAVRVCLEEAKKLGLEAWVYDEDRWPSGSAGGLVTGEPANRMRYVVAGECKDWKGLSWSKDVLAIFLVSKSEAGIRVISRIKPNQKKPTPKHGELLLVFRIKIAPECDLYNGNTYLDTLNPDAVKAFIKKTHEEYGKRFGDYFPHTVTAFFTDEPQYGGKLDGVGKQQTNNGEGLPWTDRLPETFFKRYGYDVTDHLPELFYNLENQKFTRPRLNYNDCITHLFATSFIQQIADWCERHKVLLTGHVLMEDLLSGQSAAVGSNMRAIQAMQAPGMDLLTEFWRVYGTAKQISSVARQMGRTWRLSEMYGCTGWDFPLEGHKALGDWQAALGINLRCPHLAWFTAGGETKRDYPASIFFHSPWWDEYARIEDYYSRIHVAMTRGEEVRDILLVHPIESMWLYCRKGWLNDPDVAALDEEFILMTHTLLDANLDFDYGDEEMMAQMGKVVKKPSSAVLQIGRAEYSQVVVPPMLTMRASTLKLLKLFRDAGGHVVFCGNPAENVDAVSSGAVKAFARSCLHSPTIGEELVRKIESCGRRLSIADAKGHQIGAALYLLREDDDAFYLFIANTGCQYNSSQRIGKNPFLTSRPPADVAVSERTLFFPSVFVRGFEGANGKPLELNPHTGEVFTACADRSGSSWQIKTDLPRLGSRLFVVPKNKLAKKFPVSPVLRVKKRRPLNPENWQVSLSECNVGVLDNPCWRTTGRQWKGPQEVLQVDRALRDQLGIPHRGGEALQPWKKGFVQDAPIVPLELKYTFNVAEYPSGEIYLGIESPELFRIYLNDEPVDTDMDSGWWFDPSLRRIPLKQGLIRKGVNTVRLATGYSENHPGLEIVYLLGSFGVSFKNEVVSLGLPVSQLKIGDWTEQGLPFYSGNVCYRSRFRVSPTNGEKVFIQIDHAQCAAIKVYVNDAEAGLLYCSPWEVEVTPSLRPGNNDVVIEVLGHRRNSHGPFHYDESKPLFIGPGSFMEECKAWTKNYQLVPCGLMSSPKLLLKNRK